VDRRHPAPADLRPEPVAVADDPSIAWFGHGGTIAETGRASARARMLPRL
jgi:hypothetical protein